MDFADWYKSLLCAYQVSKAEILDLLVDIADTRLGITLRTYGPCFRLNSSVVSNNKAYTSDLVFDMNSGGGSNATGFFGNFSLPTFLTDLSKNVAFTIATDVVFMTVMTLIGSKGKVLSKVFSNKGAIGGALVKISSKFKSLFTRARKCVKDVPIGIKNVTLPTLVRNVSTDLVTNTTRKGMPVICKYAPKFASKVVDVMASVSKGNNLLLRDTGIRKKIMNQLISKTNVAATLGVSLFITLLDSSGLVPDRVVNSVTKIFGEIDDQILADSLVVDVITCLIDWVVPDGIKNMNDQGRVKDYVAYVLNERFSDAGGRDVK